MSDLRKAAELALEALEQTPTVNKLFDSESYEKQKDAIDALRQALAQPKQEPTIAYSIGAEIASEDWINALKQSLIKDIKKKNT